MTKCEPLLRLSAPRVPAAVPPDPAALTAYEKSWWRPIKGLNDHYVQGCEFEPDDESRSEIFRQLVQTIREKDRLCTEGVGDYNMIMAGLFARPMRAETRARFEASGWEVIDLPANPYIPRAT
jgi:hypothetical protein